MEKIITLSMVLCLGLSLFAFSPSPTETQNYSDITVNGTMLNVKQVSSFQEAEESATTEDKGTWAKRHKTWTDFAKTAKLNSIESILNKN